MSRPSKSSKRNDGRVVASNDSNAHQITAAIRKISLDHPVVGSETFEDSAAILEATEPLGSQRNLSNDVLEEAKDVAIPALEAVEPATQSEPQLTKDSQAEAKADQGCRAVVEESKGGDKISSSPEVFDQPKRFAFLLSA